MKIKKPKRIMSLFLAALMCVTSLVGIGTTAYAAEETDDVYLISYPRDGDSNYNAEWGHGSLTFMNGWKTGTSRYTTVRAMGSYNGNICYCIEIGVPQQTGDSFTKKGEDFWDNYPASYNSTISPDDIKLFIGRIFQYGYTGTISTSWRSQNEGGDKLAHAVATQLLIWETVIGERDENFNKVSTGGKDAVLDQISRNHPLYDKIMSYYNSMAASVQKHSKLPSFLSKTPGSAQEIELKWDGSKYTVTLTDSNNVLSGYKFSSNNSGVQFSVSGNKLTITAEKAPSDGLTITAEKTAQRKGVITWTDGIYGPNGGVQDTVTYAQTVNDPVKGFLKLKVSYGSAKIVKTSEDGKVDGISFRIQGNGIDKTVKTENGGQIQVDNLMPGVYTVTEQEYDRYEPQESRRVTVVAGQVATVNFNNTLKRGDIEVIKSSEDNFNEGVTFHLYGTSLSGIAVDEYTVELIYAGQNVAVTETATSFVNERQKVEVSLEKALETNELFGIGNNGEIKKISFGLFADEELVSASGTSIPKDGLLEIITLDENGRATVGTDLPLGSYYVKELATDEHYQLSGEKYPVVFEYAGQEAATVVIAVNDGEPMENKLIYGSVSGKKVDENGEGLGGALIGLFKSNDVEFTEENALMTAVSGDDGSFAFENVPYGNWYIREIKPITGFVLNETVYDVNISENEQVVEIEIVNELLRGNIALTKVDAEYTDTKLTGAVFEVYKDTNDNGELDSEDELIGTLTEKEIGQYEMNDLLYGRYFILESASPDSYIRDEGVYEVFIDTDGKTYQVENTEGKGFANEPMRGNLKIVKTSSDGKVEGFAFRITGANGYDVTLETDENGEIFLEGLRIGEYKISEVNNSVSAMYILPADKEAAVQVGSTTVVEMHNELRDTPKTGDNSKLGLWLALAGVSVAGIAACGIIGFKKKKKEDN